MKLWNVWCLEKIFLCEDFFVPVCSCFLWIKLILCAIHSTISSLLPIIVYQDFRRLSSILLSNLIDFFLSRYDSNNCFICLPTKDKNKFAKISFATPCLKFAYFCCLITFQIENAILSAILYRCKNGVISRDSLECSEYVGTVSWVRKRQANHRPASHLMRDQICIIFIFKQHKNNTRLN